MLRVKGFPISFVWRRQAAIREQEGGGSTRHAGSPLLVEGRQVSCRPGWRWRCRGSRCAASRTVGQACFGSSPFSLLDAPGKLFGRRTLLGRSVQPSAFNGSWYAAGICSSERICIWLNR